MYTIEVKFKIISLHGIEEQEDAICTLFDTWRMNGQVLNNEHIYARHEDEYKMFVLSSEKDSLHNKYNNQYAKKTIDNLISLGLEKPLFTILDKEPQDNDLCNCKSVSAYVLYTTYICLSSSLRCKKCFGTIPLYKIPKIYDESDYRACDSLQMNCNVGERFALKQLASLDSQLTQDGLAVCKKIQEVTRVQTYYYLYKYKAKSKKQELLRKCPKCNGEWLQKKVLHDKFDFECKKCGLLSNIAWDIR